MDVVAAARAEYERIQEAALERGPLAGMREWVDTGSPPPAALLRQAGLSSAGPEDAAAEEYRLARKAFRRLWGFSIPCREAAEALCELTPLVEVGAGTAYWAALLRNRGADIIATDPAPSSNPYGFHTGRFVETIQLTAADAIRRYTDRTVFCSWPSEGEHWAAEAFADIRPGMHLALIGTGRGGVTGNEALFDLLDQDFSLIRSVEIPQFPGITDDLSIYLRR